MTGADTETRTGNAVRVWKTPRSYRRGSVTVRLGVDVGGTFTDLLLHDSESGRVWLDKTPSTPEDQSQGVLMGIAQITEQAGITVADIDQIPARDDRGDQRGA